MGTPDSEKRRLGQWADGESMSNNYESILPREAMRNIAGFPTVESYCLTRNKLTPCQALLDLVFPTINNLLNQNGYQKLISFVNGVEYSQSLKGFVQMTKLLRIILIQDSSILIHSFPNNPIFDHSLFKTNEFLDFKAQMTQLCNIERDNPAINLAHSLPEVANAINHLHQSTQENFTIQKQTLNSNLKNLDSEIKNIVPQIGDLFAESIRGINFNVQMSTAGSNRNSTASTNLNTLSDQGLLPDFRDQVQSSQNIIALQNKYEMSRQSVTVPQLWKEYFHGISNHPSVEWFESKYGSEWRGGSKSTESKFYMGRLLIIGHIQVEAAKIGLENALSQVEAERKVIGSLSKLKDAIRIRNRVQ